MFMRNHSLSLHLEALKKENSRDENKNKQTNKNSEADHQNVDCNSQSVPKLFV